MAHRQGRPVGHRIFCIIGFNFMFMSYLGELAKGMEEYNNSLRELSNALKGLTSQQIELKIRISKANQGIESFVNEFAQYSKKIGAGDLLIDKIIKNNQKNKKI